MTSSETRQPKSPRHVRPQAERATQDSLPVCRPGAEMAVTEPRVRRIPSGGPGAPGGALAEGVFYRLREAELPRALNPGAAPRKSVGRHSRSPAEQARSRSKVVMRPDSRFGCARSGTPEDGAPADARHSQRTHTKEDLEAVLGELCQNTPR